MLLTGVNCWCLLYGYADIFQAPEVIFLLFIFYFVNHPKKCALVNQQKVPILLPEPLSDVRKSCIWEVKLPRLACLSLIGFCRAPPQLGDLQQAQLTCCNEVCVCHWQTSAYTHTRIVSIIYMCWLLAVIQACRIGGVLLSVSSAACV